MLTIYQLFYDEGTVLNSESKPKLHERGTTLGSFNWNDSLALGLMPGKARYFAMFKDTMERRDRKPKPSAESSKVTSTTQTRPATELEMTIKGFSGVYTIGEAASLLEDLVKSNEFSSEKPELTITMYSDGFKIPKKNANEDQSVKTRTIRVCLSKPKAIHPAQEHIFSKRRVSTRSIAVMSGTIDDEEYDGGAGEYVEEEAPDNETARKRTRT